MSRKEASFTQLYDYITRDKDNDARFNYHHNFLGLDREAILNEFKNNANLLTKRKNGNYLYHEIVSISRTKKISEIKQKQALFDIIQQYIQSRAKDCLVFSGIHDEKDHHLHFHLIISANKIGKSKRYRLAKQTFDEIKKGLEIYVLDKYPQLEQEKLISKTLSHKSLSNKEQAVRRRTGKKTKKEAIREQVRDCLEKSSSQSEFEQYLQHKHLKYYRRGEKTIGVVDLRTGRKYRLTTLGLESEFKALQDRMNKNQKKEAIKTSAKEWIFGDFSDREEKARKEAYRKQNKKDKKVKKFKDQNSLEKTAEVIDEWVFADFSKEEARKRNEENEKRLQAWRKRKEEAEELENKKEKNKK